MCIMVFAATKILFMYFFSGNCAASVPISIFHIHLSAQFLFLEYLFRFFGIDSVYVCHYSMCTQCSQHSPHRGFELVSSWFEISCSSSLPLIFQQMLKPEAGLFLLTWRYLSWRAAEDSAMTSEASRRAREAFCSPSAAITCTREIWEIVTQNGGWHVVTKAKWRHKRGSKNEWLQQANSGQTRD